MTADVDLIRVVAAMHPRMSLLALGLLYNTASVARPVGGEGEQRSTSSANRADEASARAVLPVASALCRGTAALPPSTSEAGGSAARNVSKEKR